MAYLMGSNTLSSLLDQRARYHDEALKQKFNAHADSYRCMIMSLQLQYGVAKWRP